MRKLTPFRIGLSLMVIGSVWVALAFSFAEKTSQELTVGTKESTSIDLDLKNKGLGFYKITIPNYSKETVLVKVLDPQGNVVDLKRIGTKMSVNYFEFSYTGKYTLEMTNLSENPIQIKAEFGNTKSVEFTFPSFIALIGACLIVWSGYKRLRNYSTAQPEENKS
ncbi:hypothetical protein HY212_01765 [Candidatus Pacearchaeota archaeon]|nr:hypothetical protein [Candidatus Pacearchaeota archaeon]